MTAPNTVSTVCIGTALIAYHGFVRKMTSEAEALALLPTTSEAFLRCGMGTLIDLDEPAAQIAEAFIAVLPGYVESAGAERRAFALAEIDDTIRLMQSVDATPSAPTKDPVVPTFDPASAIDTLRAIDDAASAIGTETPAPSTADALVRGILQVLGAQGAPAPETFETLASILGDMLFYFSTEDATVLHGRIAALLRPAD